MKKGKVNNLWLSAGMAFVFSLSLLLLTANVCESAPKVYVIGGMQGLSGPAYTPWIDNIVMATELAVDEINKAGGVDGVPMKIVWEDHQAKGPVAVSAFNKLILQPARRFKGYYFFQESHATKEKLTDSPDSIAVFIALLDKFRGSHGLENLLVSRVVADYLPDPLDR